MENKKKVVVGMSGGVDSAVAAYLLEQQGYEVIGVTIKIWDSDREYEYVREDSCCGLSAVSDARGVAASMGIPYYVYSFSDIFEDKIIKNFVEEYRKGHTPNPCVLCNREIKWRALLERAKVLGADYVATGHYASIEKLPNGRYCVKMDGDIKKDQTYALNQLTQEELSHTLFPLGGLDKPAVREIAAKAKLLVANKPDSQEICFVNDNDYAGFIKNYDKIEDEPGNFVLEDGEILGRHKGIIHYTIGQRKGLGLSLKAPLYVKRIDPERNEVVLSSNEELFASKMLVRDINYMAIEDFEDGLECIVKVRYAHKGTPAKIYHEGDGIRVEFEENVRAITPGQAAVFYDNERRVLIGGIIVK